jgi:hypothetical protein
MLTNPQPQTETSFQGYRKYVRNSSKSFSLIQILEKHSENKPSLMDKHVYGKPRQIQRMSYIEGAL